MLERIKKFRLFPEEMGFFPYIFILYIILPAYYISTEQGTRLIFGIGLLLLFFVTYRQLYFSNNVLIYTMWLVIQIMIIIILVNSYDLYNLYLGFFSTYFIGWYKTKWRFYTSWAIFSVIMIAHLLIHWETIASENLYYMTVFTIIMLVAPFGIRSMNSRMELEKKLDEANETIKEFVKREERMRIARDLHDTLGHTLSMITLKSQLVHRLIEKDMDRAMYETREIEKTSRSALKQVRELVSDMRATTIAEELVEIEVFLQTARIAYRYEGDTEFNGIPLLTQNILSMCLKEGVTNIVKHSKANNCVVQLVKTAGEIKLSIYDDGKGFDESTRNGNGIKGIQERLELIDGALDITSSGGTKLVITVPIIVKKEKVGVRS